MNNPQRYLWKKGDRNLFHAGISLAYPKLFSCSKYNISECNLIVSHKNDSTVDLLLRGLPLKPLKNHYERKRFFKNFADTLLKNSCIRASFLIEL